MQHYSHDDPFEREPLDSSSSTNSSRRPRPNPSRSTRRPAPAAQDYSSPAASSPYNSRSTAQMPYDNLNGNYYTPPPDDAPTPPRHGDNSYYSRGPPAHGEDTRYGYGQHHQPHVNHGPDNFSEPASSGMYAPGYNVADRNPRERGFEASPGGSHLPPPPSRTASGHYAGGGGYMYDGYNSRGNNSPMRSQASSVHNSGYSNDPYADDPYRAFSGSNPRVDRRLGEFNPNDIEDDGDDGLYYPRYSQRNSMLSSAANSDRGARPAVGAAAAVGGAAAAGGVMGGMLNRHRDAGPSYNLADGTEKKPNWKKDKDGDGMSKKMKIAIMVGVVLLIIGIVVGSVVGALVSGRRGGGGGDSDKDRGESAEDDQTKNGDLDINSDEIKELLNNPDLHRVFPGMDYTPIHAQYPDCVHHPPSQNNITRDMAVLSQLTNRVRLYGTDCNQTQMLIHAIDRLDLKGDVKIWLGVWQDDNSTTNARQLEQMWDVLEEYGDEPFEGLIVANEILFREEMTITELGNLLDDVRSNLTDLDLDLPVATSDLGDDWTSALARTSDYIMSNIHPFFAGITADKAAAWTMNFWENNNGGFFKSDDKKNIISETGWPTGGGKNCGGSSSCSEGSVAGIDELNTFMGDFVCQALKNGTNYFWFSAFDEPWKIAYNEDGKEWEDKWGLMDVNRNLKDGVKIPDCDGDTI